MDAGGGGGGGDGDDDDDDDDDVTYHTLKTRQQYRGRKRNGVCMRDLF